MGAHALTVGVAVLSLAMAPQTLPASGDPALFQAMSAQRVEPPVSIPQVTFRDLDGQPVSLSGFRGRPVLLTFFTTW